jgi:glycosyltransferase involved in cell wall biosynthesis
LAKWNGPTIESNVLSLYPENQQEGELLCIVDCSPNSWLLVPEVTHITYHDRPKTWNLLAAAKQLGLRSAFIFYDAIPLRREELKDSIEAHSEYMRQLKNADIIIPISQWSANDFLNFQSKNCSEIDAKPIVKAIHLPSESILGSRARDLTFLKENKGNLILSVGSITSHKNQIKLLRAFNSYCNKNRDTNWRLELIGHVHPALAGELNNLIAQNSRITHYPGASDEYLKQAYADCSFTVFPSVEEGFGLPIVESLWFGKPSICANFGAPSEVGEKGGCLLIDVKNEAEIESAITRLINDTVLYDNLCKEAISINLDTWDDYANKVKGILSFASIGNRTGRKDRRIFWLGMHKILVQTELKRLRNLGYEVFYPPYLSNVVDQSADLNWDASQETTLPREMFLKLAETNFFYASISDEIYRILNEYFSTVIVTIAPPWLETIMRGFNGKVIYRVYGQTHSQSVEVKNRGLMHKVSGNRNFIFMPHAAEAVEAEEPWIRQNERIAPYCLTDDIFGYQDSWNIENAIDGEVALTCPNIANKFFNEHYVFLKAHYTSDYFRMYGVQTSVVNDKMVVGTLPRHEQMQHWTKIAAYVYTYTDPRVCYLPPIECMVIGVPVLFVRGSLLDKYFTVDTPARFDTAEQAIEICERIRSGDNALIQEIIRHQCNVRKRYTPSYVWPIFDEIIKSEIKL